MVDIAKFDRQLLAQVFKNPQAIRAFENIQKNTVDNAIDIQVALDTATAAGIAASAANSAAVTANAAAMAAAASAATANISATDSADMAQNAYALAAQADDANSQMASDFTDVELRPVQFFQIDQVISDLSDAELSITPFIGTLAQQNDDYVAVGQFAANGKVPQSAATLTAAATDLPTVIALANSIRAALIACGIGQ